MIMRHAVIHGRVQGVGYRAWTEDLAQRLHLEGWVRNRRDGTVEAVFSGPEKAVLAALEACRTGPRGAHVEKVEVDEGDPKLLEQRHPGARFTVLRTE